MCVRSGGEHTSYTYDKVGNQTTMTYPDNSVVTYTYDLLHRLTNVKDAENQNTGYTYDAAGQLTKRWQIDPTESVNKVLQNQYT